MGLIRSYLRQRRGSLGLFGLFCVIFAVTFGLYGLPIGAVWYPAALCAAVGLCVLAVDFVRFRQRHRALLRLCEETGSHSMPLPPAAGPTEERYQQLIRQLEAAQAEARAGFSRRYADMVDYYTAWAHQIKTPIAAMGLTLQSEDTALSRRLRGELFRIQQYVEMVLVFLRLDSDTTDYLIREYPLDEILRQEVKRYAGEFISRRLELRYEPLGVSVLTDEKWLAFVIGQVLSNALKYTPSGSISIMLEEGPTLCIRDTGMGIAPEELPRIFEKGYTGSLGRLHHNASGIGLYLCRRVCANLGHTITAESVPGEGTAIRIGLGRRPLEIE